eukprot:3765877-Rhodomonas_salina.1
MGSEREREEGSVRVALDVVLREEEARGTSEWRSSRVWCCTPPRSMRPLCRPAPHLSSTPPPA